MGYYIEVPNKKDKAQQLVDLHGASILAKCPTFEEIPRDKVLICVVANRAFDAALLVHDRGQYDYITTIPDPREKWWLLMDKALASKLAGYT